MKNEALLTLIILFNVYPLKTQPLEEFTDSRDGNTYKTVTIGSQIWMAENLAYYAYDGCWEYLNDKRYSKTFGYMYNWEIARGVCPVGWHLPSDIEWTVLTDFLGGLDAAGIKMKSISGWIDDGNGTNESGFNGLAGGSRNGNGTYDYLGRYASWWTANQSNTSNAWFRFLYNADNKIYRSYSSKRNALYVRCLKN
jgi:uncharacterized protein (TIGR02145 family)